MNEVTSWHHGEIEDAIWENYYDPLAAMRKLDYVVADLFCTGSPSQRMDRGLWLRFDLKKEWRKVKK